MLKVVASWLFVLFSFSILAQTKTQVTGKVTEATTGTPIPFANVIFSGFTEGAITDFDGKFVAETGQPVDSIEVRYVGFKPRKKSLKRGVAQVIDFQLEDDVQSLAEIVVYAGENPAFPILRNVIRQKSKNDKRSLEAYDYEAYTKIEFDIDNLSEQVRKRKAVSEVTDLIDSIDHLVGEDGKPILPVLVSEAISRLYYRNDPVLRHERMYKTNVSGLGISDGTLTSQVIGATFQEYNFYRNWLNIVNKEFVSPIADGWIIYYDYDLIDSLYLDGDYCYKIDFYPKREQDLAFKGSMWITKEHFAIKQIDAHVPNTANLNYIEKIKIQQELFPTVAGPWLPAKTRVVVDVAEVTKNTAGFLAKFYISVADVVVNDPKPLEFYQNPVSMEETVRNFDENYWEEHRHEPLTESEMIMYQMIDTLKQVPLIKRTSDAAIFASTGFYKVGKIDLGPYPVVFGNNNIEGIRLGIGGRTNYSFSKKGTIGGYLAYGFLDNRFKGQLYGERILNRTKWSTIRYEYQREIDQVWLLTENISQSSLFYSLSRFGNLVDPFIFHKHRITYQKLLHTGLNQTIELKHQTYSPQYPFSFNNSEGQALTDFQVSEISFTTRYAKDEVFVINDNIRMSLGTIRWPAFNFQYTLGFANFIGSDLNYHRLKFNIQKRQKMGLFGVAFFDIGTGAIFGTLPYPLLNNPIGNETNIYASFAYNTMNFFEFSTDRYAYLRYRHSFEGLFLNSIPLIKKLKWRFVGNANVFYGQLDEKNINMVNFPLDQSGNPIIPFVKMTNKPFIELGYGVENIFKILRVDAFHRLTYLNQPNISKFELKFSLQFKL